MSPDVGRGPSETLSARAARHFEAFTSGETEGLSELVDAVTPLLWHTARAQNASKEVAEDAVQTAWLRLVDNAERIERPGAVLAWLVTTVKRETWHQLKGARRTEDLDSVGEPGSPGPSPETEVILTERQRTLWRHIRELSPRCRELLRVIAFAEKPDYAGLAESLGMPVGSIGPTRGRCLSKLRAALGADPTWEGS